MTNSGDRFKLLLAECNLSTADFAAYLRVTPQHVNNWLKRGVPLARMDEIAYLLCVRSKWLRYGIGQKYPAPAPHPPVDPLAP